MDRYYQIRLVVENEDDDTNGYIEDIIKVESIKYQNGLYKYYPEISKYKKVITWSIDIQYEPSKVQTISTKKFLKLRDMTIEYLQKVRNDKIETILNEI